MGPWTSALAALFDQIGARALLPFHFVEGQDIPGFPLSSSEAGVENPVESRSSGLSLSEPGTAIKGWHREKKLGPAIGACSAPSTWQQEDPCNPALADEPHSRSLS